MDVVNTSLNVDLEENFFMEQLHNFEKGSSCKGSSQAYQSLIWLEAGLPRIVCKNDEFLAGTL